MRTFKVYTVDGREWIFKDKQADEAEQAFEWACQRGAEEPIPLKTNEGLIISFRLSHVVAYGDQLEAQSAVPKSSINKAQPTLEEVLKKFGNCKVLELTTESDSVTGTHTLSLVVGEK